ncbi:MAG: hypothetical protein CW716_04780 [Candidatus Bathyarchaeum sp.]|nr:MAG: hypothetical protein CW716_04780 [Candidatus Bathyarchaeum sp.]
MWEALLVNVYHILVNICWGINGVTVNTRISSMETLPERKSDQRHRPRKQRKLEFILCLTGSQQNQKKNFKGP